MDHYFNLKYSLIVAAVLLLPATQAETMGKADYKAERTRSIEEYKIEKTACDSQAGNTKKICVEEAKGKELVTRAELEYRYSGKFKDRTKVLVVKAKSTYKVAKQKCDEKAGNERDVCVLEAKTVETTALADARLSNHIYEATKDANQDKRDADYKLAVEKCYALAGEAKDNCITSAKTHYGIR